MDCLYGKDCLDGDVKHIKINSSDIDYTKAGNYMISVSLINSFGDNATYDLPVHVIKNSYEALIIHLTDNLVYLKTGAKFDPAGFVKDVELNYSEELMPRKDWGINIQSNVDTSKAGVYEVRYMIKNVNDVVYGNASGVTWMTVIVVD